MSAPALLMLSLITACGGADSGTTVDRQQAQSASADDKQMEPGPISGDAVVRPSAEPSEPTTDVGPPPLASGPMRGFLSIEEFSGKRVLDAWFVDELEASGGQSMTTASSRIPDDDRCLSMAGPVSTLPSSVTGARVADAIELVSRGGLQARLEYFASSNQVTYATEQRWLREPLADDTQVNLVGNPNLETGMPPMLSSMKPLELNLPLRPVLENAEVALAWEASDHPDDRIVLTIWPKGRSDVRSTTPTLRCTLIDDGRFALSDLTEGTTFMDGAHAFRMKRERRTEHRVADMSWSIVQSSLARF